MDVSLRDIATFANSALVVILIVKHVFETRKHRLELEKLDHEVRALRALKAESASAIIKATNHEVEAYVLRPRADQVESSRSLHDGIRIDSEECLESPLPEDFKSAGQTEKILKSRSSPQTPLGEPKNNPPAGL